MFLITGLGNIGVKYANTPHNAGFLVVDALTQYLKDIGRDIFIDDWKDESKVFDSYISRVKVNGQEIGMIQKPTTYMNMSGLAVAKLSNKYDFDPFILIHDDLDIELGKYKINLEKSPKSHNGVLSVEQFLKRKDFLRVRVGIEGRENRNISGDEYVLHRMDKESNDLLKEISIDICKELVPLLNIQ